MSQMTLTKKNMTNLVLNPVHTVLGGLLRVLWITLGVTLSDDIPCDGDRGSLALGYENIGEADTGECTRADKIFSIARISDESLIDPMFVESAEMGWFESVWFWLTWIKLECFDSGLQSSWCDSSLHYFCAQLFNSKIIFALSSFEDFASKVFHLVFNFTFNCVMPRQAPDYWVEDVSVAQPGPSNLWS